MKKELQIRTETIPVFHHFPDLPDTSELQWCSETDEGIGLSTVTIYIFVFYDHDIRNELPDIEFTDEEEDIEFYFLPGGMDEHEKWRYAKNARFAFQDSLKNRQKMNTDVYINEKGTVLYTRAIGD